MNVLEKLLTIHGRRIWDCRLQCREDWFELVEAIKQTDETIQYVQWRMSNYE
jgi:hypothetical protein